MRDHGASEFRHRPSALRADRASWRESAQATPALRAGQHRASRRQRTSPGLFAFSRFDPDGSEVLLLLNTSTQPIDTEHRGRGAIAALHGAGRPVPRPTRRRRAACASRLPPLGYAVCDADSADLAMAGRSARRGEPALVEAARSIYQIYPRSFADSNGDGIGDLPGITRSSTMCAASAVDCIWLSPFFTSPMRTSATTSPTIAASIRSSARWLISTRWSRGRTHSASRSSSTRSIRTAPTSIPGFRRAVRAAIIRKADWYVWADAKPDGSPPNNWQSVFGGPAWTWDARRGQYYLHNFLQGAARPQPAQSRRCRRRCSALRGSGWTRRRRLPASTRSTSRCTTRSCATIRRRRTRRQAHAAVRFPAACLQPVASRTSSRFLERFRAVTDSYGERFTLAEVGGEHALTEMKRLHRRAKRG